MARRVCAGMESYQAAAIADLWTEDAAWLSVRNQSDRQGSDHRRVAEAHLFTGGGYDARYEPVAIDGSVAVVHGRTLYFDPATGERRGEFDNVWVLRFGPDGRCSEFHEWYAGRPEHDPSRAPPARSE